ncbi:hypothetical protein [Longitalea luteola]|uniref:hypothetical protein n=1 Tax=Longitalea luteola TaxID=2812563 RepID=UPI001A958C80|nr:hypothetical protein [Longitalea luteola]
MALLEGTIQFTGSLQNLSFYKMRGTNKIVVRKKGGPSRKKVKHSPAFANTRRNNNEFGGRAKAVRHIKDILSPLLFLADYNITGPLNALLKPIQEMDGESDLGKRHILISKEPRLLEGFTLNRRYLFESIVRTPVSCLMQKEKGLVTINIPALIPGINFIVPGNYDWFQFIAVAGPVPDLFFTGTRYRTEGDQWYGPEIANTQWLPVNAPAAGSQLTIKPDTAYTSCSTLVGLGIAFGTMQRNDIEPVKYVGGAKVIGVE